MLVPIQEWPNQPFIGWSKLIRTPFLVFPFIFGAFPSFHAKFSHIPTIWWLIEPEFWIESLSIHYFDCLVVYGSIQLIVWCKHTWDDAMNSFFSFTIFQHHFYMTHNPCKNFKRWKKRCLVEIVFFGLLSLFNTR